MNPKIRTLRIVDAEKAYCYVDVSRPEPYIVQPDRGREIPVAALSMSDMDRLKQLTTRQLLRSVDEDQEAANELRATLFFLSRWRDRSADHSAETEDRAAVTRGRALSQTSGSRHPI